MMVDQVLPDRSRYGYLPATQSDDSPKTGRPKYLPGDTCQTYGSGCEFNKKYLQTVRQKRSFISGLIKAREKLLDGSPGGFLVEMVKTIAKPIYNWVINTDNDAVMEKFTNCMLPETQYRGHHDELAIAANVRQGNEKEVWRTMSRQTMRWNPEQNFEDDKDQIHL